MFQKNLFRSIDIIIGDVWNRLQVRWVNDAVPNIAMQIHVIHSNLKIQYVSSIISMVDVRVHFQNRSETPCIFIPRYYKYCWEIWKRMEKENETKRNKKKMDKRQSTEGGDNGWQKRTFCSSELLLNRIDCVRYKHTLLNIQTILFFLYSFSFYYFISFIVWSANCLKIFYEIFHLFQCSFRTDYDSLLAWYEKKQMRSATFTLKYENEKAKHSLQYHF